jgi:hypothetical protein
LLSSPEDYTLVLEDGVELSTAVASVAVGALAFPLQKQYEGEHIAQVYTFVRQDGRKVQLVTTLDAVLAVILQFHSSMQLRSHFSFDLLIFG